MAEYKLISADSHIVEPPDMYSGRIAPKFRDRAPKMERRKTPTGREYDAWVINGMQVGTLGAVMQAGQRFEDPSQIDFLGVWEDVRKGGYDAHAMIKRTKKTVFGGRAYSRAKASSGTACRTASCCRRFAVRITTGSPISANPIPSASKASACSMSTMSTKLARSSRDASD